MTTGRALPPLPALAVGHELPTYSVTAHNNSLHSDNKIHDDDVARKYGFKGGLVPGVTVYAYLSSMLAAGLGERWLTSGEATVTLVNPLYEGEQAISRAVVTAVEPEATGDRIALDAWTENPAGERCATGAAIAFTGESVGFGVPEYRDQDTGPAPDPRPELFLETARAGSTLARLISPTTPDDARRYAAMVFDANPLFSERSSWGPPLMHPGWLLGTCNSIFVKNFVFGPWIHTRSHIRYLGPALAGRTFTLHGRMDEVYERRLHHYAVLDLYCEDDEQQPVMHVRHTAIFKVHPKN